MCEGENGGRSEPAPIHVGMKLAPSQGYRDLPLLAPEEV